MPADLSVVADWTFALRSTLMGDGTAYGIDRRRGAISGLFDTLVKQPEIEYAHAPGAFAAEGYAAARTVTFALVVEGGTPTATGDGLEVMQTVWAPSTTDLSLTFQMPGFGRRFVNGRPLGIVVDYSTPDFGLIPVLASFRITDPAIYT